MITTALSFLLGVIVFQTSSELPSGYCLLLLPVSIFLAKINTRAFPLIFISSGYLWAYFFAIWLIHPSLSGELEGKDVKVSGVIEEIKFQSPHYSRFLFEIDSSTIKLHNKQIPKRVMLSWYQPPDSLTFNEHCQFVVRLKRYWHYANPGSFDKEKSMFLSGIGARGYVRSGQCEKLNTTRLRKFDLRAQWVNQFEQATSNLEHSHLMAALAFGERKDIQQHEWKVLRDTGTSHLLAISGLHLSAVSMVMFLICHRLVRFSATLCERYTAHRIAAVLALIAAIFYAYLAGFSLPTQRALIMVSIGLMAILLRKPVVSYSLLATALFVVLVINPMSVLSAGFWMSFSAVLFIFFILKMTQHKKQWLSILYVQCYLGAALFPVSLLFFSEASLISPLVNLIAIPLVSFIILPALLFSLVLFLAGMSISLPLLEWVDVMLMLLWSGLEMSSQLIFASIIFYPTLLGVFAYEVGLWLIIQPNGLPAKYLAWLLLPALFLIKEPKLAEDQMRLTVLDVGQGLSVVIETAHHSLVYDAGPRSLSGFSTGSAVVIPYLQTRSIHHVDLAIVSHDDNDHSGGMHAVLEALEVDRLLVSHRPERFSFNQIELCRAGHQWQWDGIDFIVLHPPNKWQSSDNDRSCVIQIRHPAGTVLLTGDIEKSAEKWLVDQYGDNLGSDLLLVPHHGSRSSSSYRFVGRVHPQTAVFSAGYMNRYRFPHATIMRRYQESGAQIVDITHEGAVTFLFDTELGLQKQPGYREQHKRYWHSTKEQLTDPIE